MADTRRDAMFTRRHYKYIAEWIRQNTVACGAGQATLVDACCDMFRNQPNFKATVFRKACGSEPDVSATAYPRPARKASS